MPIEVRNEEEAKLLAQAAKDGLIPADREAEVMQALNGYHNEVKTFVAPGISFEAMKDAAIAGPEVLLTVASAGVSEIASGWGALLSAPMGLDAAVENKESISRSRTYQPRSKAAKQLLQDVAPSLMKIEQGIDYIAEKRSGGNPIAATAIKTTLLGGLELLPPSKGTFNTVKARIAIRKREKEIRKIASDKGINLDLKNYSDDLADAARKLTPDERAQNAPALVEALQSAKDDAFKAKKDKFKAAKESRTYVDTGAVKDLSASVFRELVDEGFDLREMKGISNILEELDAIDVRLPGVPGKKGQLPLPAKAAHLNQIELLRKRTNKFKFGTPESTAGSIIRNSIDDFLDIEFNKAVIQDGRIVKGGALSGDAGGIKAWRDARLAHKGFVERFKADKTISQLIEQDATPEQYSAWLMGASAVNAKRQAALTIKRMKEVLGKDHPSLEGIRQDYLFEMYEPLLKEVPNFSQFTRNYDSMIRRNPSLVKELGLDAGAMRDMHDFAKVQANLPPSGKIFTKGDIVTGVTRMAVGHQIAKAAVRVEFSRRLANAVAGVDAVTPKQIIADIMDIKFDQVAIPRTGPLAAEFIAGAAITGLEDEE